MYPKGTQKMTNIKNIKNKQIKINKQINWV
jgi:hypothetical protein